MCARPLCLAFFIESVASLCRDHIMCVGIITFVLCPLFSSLVLLSVHCIVLSLLSKHIEWMDSVII